MGNVSTRPHVSANSGGKTKSPVAPPLKSGKAASPIEKKASPWRVAAIEARNAVADLVHNAQLIDDESDDSSDMAERLLALVISDLGETNTDAEKDLFEHAFFNAEALIHGALNMPTDPVGPKVEANLRHALNIIDKMTDHLCGRLEVQSVFDAIRTAPVEIQAKRDPLHGNSPAQAALVFERIASMADTAVDLLVADSAHGAELIIEYIGALADSMIGEAVIGSTASWAAGSQFAKAVQA